MNIRIEAHGTSLDSPVSVVAPEHDPVMSLAIGAIESARKHSSWSHEKFRSAPLFVGTSKGPILSFLQACRLQADGKPLPPPLARLITQGPASLGSMLADFFKQTGDVHTSVAACASGIHALHRACRAIDRRECHRAVVVAADASIHPLFESSFERLGVLSKPDAQGRRHCRPFDPAAEGFYLAQNAAALFIESESSSTKNRDGRPRIEHTWIGADGTHLIATDPQAQTLKHGLRLCHQQNPSVDFIHAHATGTAHDAHELSAIRSLWPTVRVFSHKRWFGHSLGAAGLLAVTLSARCHQTRQTLDNHPLPPHSRSITIAQGFGGHIALCTLAS